MKFRSIHNSMTVKELKSWFAALPNITGQTRWDKHCLSLRDHVRRDIPSELLKWSTIQATMFVANAPYVSRELDDLKQAWERWKWALVDPLFGEPTLYPEEFSTMNNVTTKFHTSGNYIHQAYRLKQWEQKTQIQLNDMRSIVEFGGGYGALRVMANSLGFDGQYSLYDLPELTILQEYYASNVIPGINQSTQYTSRAQDLPTETDLLIAVASISEVPVPVRDEFLNHIDARNYYIVFQPYFHEVDNVEYFRKFIESKTVHNWELWTSDLIPHFFLAGTPK